MRLTLLRHAAAVDQSEWHGDDASRPLTKSGKERAVAMLKQVRDLIDAGEIWTSPRLRARSTAELACGIWKLPLREMSWLAGGAASNDERVEQLVDADDVVLVGHEPDLGELIGHLIGSAPLPLKKCGLALLKGEPLAGGMELIGLLAPKTVRTLSGLRLLAWGIGIRPIPQERASGAAPGKYGAGFLSHDRAPRGGARIQWAKPIRA